MATFRQILANRLNSEKSTGPTTQVGKAASRANALKHGLTGAGVVVPHDDAEAIARRMEAWQPNYQLTTSEDEWFFREMVTQSIRIDRCHEQESTLLTQIALRASLCWDDDRRLDAEQLGDKLAKKPARITHQLTRTSQGCEWMLERWLALDAILESGGEWTDSQRSLALDLLGTPLELRDPSDTFGSRSDVAEAALIRTQIDRLEALKTEALDSLDQFERVAAEQGYPLETPRSLAQLRRYEATCLKRFQAGADQLLGTRAAETPKNLEQSPQPAPAEPPTPPRLEPIAPTEAAPLPLPRNEPTRPIVRAASMAPARTEMNRQQRRAARKLAGQSR